MPLNRLLIGQNSTRETLFEQNRHLGRPWSKAITTSVMILSAFSSCFQTMSTISCAQRIRGFIVVRFLLKRVEREPLSLSLSNMIIIVRGTHGLQLKSIFLYSDLKQYIFFRSLPYRQNKEAIQYRMLSLIDSLFLFSDSMSICHKSLSWFLDSVHS